MAATSDTQPGTNPTWRWIVLAFWALIALAYLTFFLLDSRLDYFQIREACQGADCNWQAITPAEAGVLESWGLSTEAYAVFMIGTTVITVAVYWLLAGLILIRQGATRIGVAVSLAMLVIPIATISDADNLYRNYPTLFFPSMLLWFLGIICLLVFFYLFPNGRLYPRLAWVGLAGTILVITLTFILETTGLSPRSLNQLPIVLLLLNFMIFLGLGFQIARYRKGSTPLERQQTKWVLYGFFLFALGIPIWTALFGGVIEIPAGEPRLLAVLGGWFALLIILLALPVSIAIAILRYRLWDIDVLIRRTLVYGVLTVILALVYLGSVLLLQSLVNAVGGSQSTVAIVLSTLAIAALFTPLRRRIQNGIDRRFYRRRYDAEKALAVFSQTVREEVDLDNLSRSLLGVVEDTMQPEKATLWLLENSDGGPFDRGPQAPGASRLWSAASGGSDDE